MRLLSRIRPFLPPIVVDKVLELKSYWKFKEYKTIIVNNVSLKKMHLNQRCFILGSGPSIKNQDLRPLKNEVVFALNNFYTHPDFSAIIDGNFPKYYLIAPIHPPQTEQDWVKWFRDMECHIPQSTRMIFGINSFSGNIKYLCDKYNLFNGYENFYYFAGIDTNQYYKFTRRHVDVTQVIWNANTASIYALIFAIYMGFKEIYFLGMDHNQICIKGDINKRFYEKAVHNENNVEREVLESLDYKINKFLNAYNQWLKYGMLKKYAEERSQFIFNCTPNSMLDIFECKDYEEVLNNSLNLGRSDR